MIPLLPVIVKLTLVRSVVVPGDMKRGTRLSFRIAALREVSVVFRRPMQFH
jgi:hypothetical protein